MRKWLPAALIFATVVFSVSVYSRLPDPMVIHWNVAGEPDGYGSRVFGTFLLPAVILALWGLLLVLPRIDPRKQNIEQFRDTYDIFVIAVVAVLCALQVGILGYALGWPIQIGRLAPIAIGTLLVMLGILLPRFRSNFFFGIRTPWTLSSDAVWARTHRVGGYAMVLMGALLAMAGIAGTQFWLVLAVAGSLVLVLAILVYSYVLWRAEQRSK
jgi:uncharacterized membrane protein